MKPKTYSQWQIANQPSPNYELLPRKAYDAGIAEGRRYERENKLLKVAMAAMQGMLATSEDNKADREYIVSVSLDYAKSMLAEAEKRRDEN